MDRKCKRQRHVKVEVVVSQSGQSVQPVHVATSTETKAFVLGTGLSPA